MAKELTKDERIIVRGYKEGLKNIRNDINLLYEKYAKDGKLSAADLSKYNRLTNLEKNIADNLKTAYDIQVKTTKKAVKGAFESAFYYGTFELEQEAKMNLMFGLLKKEAVNAVVEGPNRWPQIAKGHTKLTNTKIRDQIMQGVVQGKDAGQVTKAVAKEMNIAASKACRIVRTETHRAQNQGSLDSYTEAYKKGVLIQKVWVATLDDRTRDSHRVMDGQIVEVYEDFIMPGDIKASAPGLSGSASGDINCRCTIRAEVVGFTPQARRARGDGIIPQQTYQQWAKSKGIPFNKDMADEVKKLLEARGQTKPEDKLKEHLEEITSKLAKYKINFDKTYSGIWKDSVKVTDYPDKKDAIPAKIKYFHDHAISASSGDDAAKFRELLKLTEEFEKQGKKYLKHQAAIEKLLREKSDITKELRKYTSADLASVDLSRYDQQYKDAAFWFQGRYGADGVLRKRTGELWKTLSSEEREALYTYTSGSGKFNRPLRGYEGSWQNYKGIGQVDLDYEGGKAMIEAATKALDRCSYDFDIWLQRGIETPDGAAGFLGIKTSELALSEKELQDLLIDKVVKDEAFLSTSACKGSGFSGDLIVNLYAPRGTKMIYAEPFSDYGRGAKLAWDGETKQSNFGNEFEVILQRGSSYKITKVEKVGGQIYIDVDVFPPEL
jgi:SPP1 gp7 family putative phage head morphogenesis protein